MASRKIKQQQRSNKLTAFTLVPVVEQIIQNREIECACSYEKNLYVGTTDGLVLYYGLMESQTPYGKAMYQSKLKGRKQLDGDKRKSVQQVTALPAISRLLVLVEGSLYLLDMYNLEIIDARERINKVTCFCINESKLAQQSLTVEIVIGQQKKKSLCMYTLSNDRFTATKEIPVTDLPVALARDGDTVCVALSTQHFNAGRYSLINIKGAREPIDLPSFPIGSTPIVKRTAKDQFLISTGDIGVMVTERGESDRPPIPWVDPSAAALFFPYLLTFSQSKQNIVVYSLLDQQMVQEIPFKNGKWFSSSHGKIVATLSTSVYMLVRVPLKDQVTQLLDQHCVDEAIILAETVAAVDEVKDEDKAFKYLRDVKERAAFVYFTLGEFSTMETLLLEESLTDPRELISKFEGLLIKSSTFVPKRDVPSAQVLASAEMIDLKKAKQFLIKYLKDVRVSQLAIGIREEIDTALVKLLAEEQPRNVAKYIINKEDLFTDFEETKETLKANSCHYALALLYHRNGHTDSMMKICTDIYDKKRTDPSFPGLDYIVDFLKRCNNKDILEKYSRWLLERDESKGVLVFTEEPEQLLLSPAVVLELLAPYNTATVVYLEYLINVKYSKEEEYHTRLGTFYLENVLNLKEQGNKEELTLERYKLKSFLETSTHYRASFLLNRVQDSDLHQECAILYGKMEEHHKALTLLAHELQDYDGAEQYCELYSKGRSRQYCQNLYQILLTVYLRPSDSSKPPLVKPALRLLNTQGANFDASKVLELLPSQWDINTVKEFLMRSLRNTTHTSRTVKIEQSLAKGENLQVRYDLMKLQKNPAIVSDKKVCPVCQLPFTEATAIVRYPNGIVTHLKCGRNKNICPITGTWFGE